VLKYKGAGKRRNRECIANWSQPT